MTVSSSLKLQKMTDDFPTPYDKYEVRNDDLEYPGTLNPRLFDQKALSDLARDLDLSKESSELLASRLKGRHMLAPGAKISFYRNREKNFLPFSSQETNLVFCNNVEALLEEMGLETYTLTDWRLFIDSSKRCLKCVLLHNGNKYSSIPIGHSTTMKEEYSNILMF